MILPLPTCQNIAPPLLPLLFSKIEFEITVPSKRTPVPPRTEIAPPFSAVLFIKAQLSISA